MKRSCAARRPLQRKSASGGGESYRKAPRKRTGAGRIKNNSAQAVWLLKPIHFEQSGHPTGGKRKPDQQRVRKEKKKTAKKRKISRTEKKSSVSRKHHSKTLRTLENWQPKSFSGGRLSKKNTLRITELGEKNRPIRWNECFAALLRMATTRSLKKDVP